MVPEVGRSRPTIILAIVVLPEPDSPTIASDSPAGTENETSSTAVKSANFLVSCETSSIGHLQPAAKFARANAPGRPAVELRQRHGRRTAPVGGVRAPRRERAPGRRRLERRQRPAGDRPQPGSGPVDVG